MRWIFYVLTGLLISAGLGWLVANDSGYVLMQHASWTVELSFTLLVALALVFLGVLVMVTIFLSRITTRRWRRRVLRNDQGWIALLTGDFRRARRVLARNRSGWQGRLLSEVGAVLASHGDKHWSQRDADFQRLVNNSKLPAFATGMLHARLLLDEGAPERALAVINSFLPEYRKKPSLYQLKFLCLKALNRWSEIAADLAEFKKRCAFTAEEFAEIQHKCALVGLHEASYRGVEALEKAFRSLPSVVRAHPEVTKRYAQGLMDNGQMIDAEKWLARELSARWDTELLSLYGDIKLASYDRMFEQCKIWLKERPEDQQLLFLSGKMAFLSQVWGLSRTYLESSLLGKPWVETYILLGQLMERLDDPKKASVYYRQATQLYLHQQTKSLAP